MDLKQALEDEIQITGRDIDSVNAKIKNATRYEKQTGVVVRYEEERFFLVRKRALLRDALNSICRIDELEVELTEC